MIAGATVHVVQFARLVEVVLDDRQELGHLVASHGITLAIVAVSLEPPHPVCVEVSRWVVCISV